MSDEPWRILYETDIAPYSSLMLEIHKSIDAGKIQLKDSDKVLQYLDTILDSLPDLQHKAHSLRSDIDLFASKTSYFTKLKGLKRRLCSIVKLWQEAGKTWSNTGGRQRTRWKKLTLY